jgi:hypothetical protein
MSEMRFDGVEEPVKKTREIVVPLKPVIDEVMKSLSLKENKGKLARVATTATTADEAKNDVDQLRKQMRLCGCKHTTCSIKDLGNNKFCLLVGRSKKTRKKGSVTANKSGKPNAPVQPAAQQANDAAAEQVVNATIQNIENGGIPVMALPALMAQFIDSVAIKEQQLAKPGISDPEKAKLTAEKQLAQRVVAAINKKLGQ